MRVADLRGRLGVARDGMRTELWPLPTLGVGLAVILGVGLPWLDARMGNNLPRWMTENLFGGGVEAARTVLVSIAGSLITVTALTFSLTVVTLQLASSQFSPRLLRTFTRDRFVQAILALFLTTFTYALTVLRTVRTAETGHKMFVPQFSVTMAFVLALASVLGLVLFLSHLAQEVRVETMLRNVHGDANETIRRILPERRCPPTGDEALPVPPAETLPLLAGSSGFLTLVDETALLAAAVDADAVLLIDRYPGASVVAGTPIGVGWPRAASSFALDVQDRLLGCVAKAITTAHERTGVQDVGFGLRQLTDVATKALSPGINDPTTAVHALGHSSALLCELATRDLGSRLLRDDEDQVRVILCRPDLADLLDLAVAQPRRYGAQDPTVLARLTSLLCELAWHADRDRRQAIADQLARLRTTATAQNFDSDEHARLARLAEQVEQALSGRWTSGQGTP